MGKMVTLKASDGHDLSAYQADPAGTPKGAAVVVQEIFGVNAHIRSIADRLAAEGYTAIAPATFDRYERNVELKYDGSDQAKAYELYGKLKPETALLDVVAAYKFVENEDHKGIAVVGFCYGGFLSWLAATRGDELKMRPSCTVGFYPGGIGSVAAEEPFCPVMLHFGTNDAHIGPEQSEAVRKAHPEVEIFMYEGAGHAFFRDVDPNCFAPEAANLAWSRTLEFLKTHVA